MTIPSDVLEKLHSQDWEDILPRLIYHARREEQRRGWSSGRFPPEELANEAVERVFTGQRKWNPAKDPNLLAYLCGVIDSLIGHLPSQMKRILELRDMQDPAASYHDRDPDHDPEAAMLQAELDAESEATFWDLHGSMAGDPNVQGILECIHDGTTKREAMAKKLGITPGEFDNARRRLRDRLMKSHPRATTGQAKRR